MNRYHFLQICEDKFFAEVMFNHYMKLYRQRRRGWKFVAAYFAWRRAQWYKQQIEELTIQQELSDQEVKVLLTEINNQDGTKPFIVSSVG